MNRPVLIVGDIATIALVTVIGFATHGETELSFLPRVAAVFFPLTLAWFLLGPWFGLLDLEVVTNSRRLWRPLLAMIFAAPLAVVLRGLILNAAIIPIFAVILGLTSAFGMVIWRWIYFLLMRRK